MNVTWNIASANYKTFQFFIFPLKPKINFYVRLFFEISLLYEKKTKQNQEMMKTSSFCGGKCTIIGKYHCWPASPQHRMEYIEKVVRFESELYETFHSQLLANISPKVCRISHGFYVPTFTKHSHSSSFDRICVHSKMYTCAHIHFNYNFNDLTVFFPSVIRICVFVSRNRRRESYTKELMKTITKK